MLNNHNPGSRAKHRFNDVLGRVPEDDLVKLKSIEKDYLDQFETLQETMKIKLQDQPDCSKSVKVAKQMNPYIYLQGSAEINTSSFSFMFISNLESYKLERH